MNQQKKFQKCESTYLTSSNNWKKGDLIEAAIIEADTEESEITANIGDIRDDPRCITVKAKVSEINENKQIVSILLLEAFSAYNRGEIFALDSYIEIYSIEER